LSEEFNYKLKKYQTYKRFLEDLELDQRSYGGKNTDSAYFDHIENLILEDHKKVFELISGYNQTFENYVNEMERKYVYEKSSKLLSAGQNNSDVDRSLLESGNTLNYIAGAINANEEMKMKKMVFRASRGRIIISFFDFLQHNVNHMLKSQNNNDKVIKKIFVIFFQTGEERILMGKLINICDVLGASRYIVPNRERLVDSLEQLDTKISQLKLMMEKAEESIRNFLKEKTENVIIFNVE
jgi:hypothetical protein